MVGDSAYPSSARALERTHDEDSAPEPAVSSDSDVEVVGDPVVEEREWRLRKAAAGDRIPRGTTDVGGTELPRGHAEETRKRFQDREPSDEEQERSTEEEARWQVRLRRRRDGMPVREAEEEERPLWEAPVEDSWGVPLSPRYAVEEPGPRSEDGDEPCAPSPPRWLPEVPPTPRYEGEWLTEEARDSDGGAPLATPPWRPARPPTPRYTKPQRPEAQPQTEESTAQPMPQPHEEAVHQTQAEEPTVVRTEPPTSRQATIIQQNTRLKNY